jgi:hypothetical protein
MLSTQFSTNRFRVITPSDTVLQTYECAATTGDPGSPLVITGFKYLYVTVTGNVVVKNDAGTAVTFTNAAAGTLLPISGNIVMAATAGTVIGIF